MSLRRLLVLAATLLPAAPLCAGSPPHTPITTAPPPALALSDRWALDLDTSVLLRVTDTTPLNYTVIATAVSLRTPEHIRIELDQGAKIVVRGYFSLLAEAFVEGAESTYFGFSGSPSIEFWPRSESFSLYFAIGGGLGVVDSSATEGGQGQDLTLNWFVRTGMRFHITPDCSIGLGIHFQHLSNGGMADRNPGLDALGPSVGLSYRF
ncbi:hypothetical protein BH23VER1_BH23VER1_08460 [soil metagenome]